MDRLFPLCLGIFLTLTPALTWPQLPPLEPYADRNIAAQLPRGWQIKPNERGLLAEENLQRPDSPGIILAITPYDFKLSPEQAAQWISEAAGGRFKVTDPALVTSIGPTAIQLDREQPQARCVVMVWPDPQRRFSIVAVFAATPAEFAKLGGLRLLEIVATGTHPAGMRLAQAERAPAAAGPIPKEPKAITEIRGIADVPNAPREAEPGSGDVETRVRVDRVRSATGDGSLLQHGSAATREHIVGKWSVTELDSSLTPAQFDAIGSGFSIEFRDDGRYLIHYRMSISTGVLHSGTETSEQGRYEIQDGQILLKPSFHKGWIYNFNPKDKHPIEARNGPARAYQAAMLKGYLILRGECAPFQLDLKCKRSMSSEELAVLDFPLARK